MSSRITARELEATIVAAFGPVKVRQWPNNKKIKYGRRRKHYHEAGVAAFVRRTCDTRSHYSVDHILTAEGATRGKAIANLYGVLVSACKRTGRFRGFDEVIFTTQDGWGVELGTPDARGHRRFKVLPTRPLDKYGKKRLASPAPSRYSRPPTRLAA